MSIICRNARQMLQNVCNDDVEYMLPVLTTVTLNVLTRTMKKEVDGSNKPTNEPTSEMFG